MGYMYNKSSLRKIILLKRKSFDEYAYFDLNNRLYDNVLRLLSSFSPSVNNSKAADDSRGRKKSIIKEDLLPENSDSALFKALSGKRNDTLGLYFPLKSEPDLLKLAINSSWNICLPKIASKEEMNYVLYNIGDRLVESIFTGVYEPSGNEIVVPDIVLVPGLAFDIKGYRLGFGMGHFDRYFAFKGKISTVKIGVCYDDMLLESVPRDSHDVRMNYIVTEKNIYKY